METTTPQVVRDIVDGQAEQELWVVGRLFEHPPYFIVGKGGDTRLTRALRVVQEGRITPNSDGSFTVEGSAGRTYRCTDSCSCPNSQKSSSKWCYHLISTALYVEWQRRIHPQAPVNLGTLRPGTLPLPPTTVDERLALGTIHDSTALSTHHTPQEDRMDDHEYIPEPDDLNTPMAVLERPVPEPARVTAAVAAGHALLPSLDAESLKRSMQEWSAQRQVIKSFLQQELKEGIDFYRLQVRGKDANPTLSKAGAEKFLGLFQLQASFMPDIGTWEMLGKPIDVVFYVCTLMTRNGEVVGEGRGARSLKKDGGDANKAIKMSEKSALIDAVLRTGALSEVYTQDIEDLQDDPAKSAPAKPNPLHPSAELRQRIWAKVQELAPEARTREAVEAFIKERTGMALHPDLYSAILARLEERA